MRIVPLVNKNLTKQFIYQIRDLVVRAKNLVPQIGAACRLAYFGNKANKALPYPHHY